MTPDRWQRVAKVYQLAAEQDPAARDIFLSQACAGDEALRARSNRCCGRTMPRSFSIGRSGPSQVVCLATGSNLRPAASLDRFASRARSVRVAWAKCSAPPTPV